MPSKAKPLTDAQLLTYESRRDLAAELLESVRQMKAGKTQVVPSPSVEARERTGLSQSQFAALLAWPCARFKDGSKVASSRVVRRVLCSPLHALTRRPCWLWLGNERGRHNGSFHRITFGAR